MRIANGVDRGKRVSFTFNGRAYVAYEGESVAAALFAAGVAHLRDSPHAGRPRGMFCLMGSCQECLVWVEGHKTLACQQPALEGLTAHSVTERDA